MVVALLGPAATESFLVPACLRDAAQEVLAPPATSPPATVAAAAGEVMAMVPAAVATAPATVLVVAMTVENPSRP